MMQECQSWVSHVSVNMLPDRIKLNPCSVIWRTHTRDCNWLSSSYQGKHLSMVSYIQDDVCSFVRCKKEGKFRPTLWQKLGKLPVLNRHINFNQTKGNNGDQLGIVLGMEKSNIFFIFPQLKLKMSKSNIICLLVWSTTSQKMDWSQKWAGLFV